MLAAVGARSLDPTQFPARAAETIIPAVAGIIERSDFEYADHQGGGGAEPATTAESLPLRTNTGFS